MASSVFLNVISFLLIALNIFPAASTQAPPFISYPTKDLHNLAIRFNPILQEICVLGVKRFSRGSVRMLKLSYPDYKIIKTFDYDALSGAEFEFIHILSCNDTSFVAITSGMANCGNNELCTLITEIEQAHNFSTVRTLPITVHDTGKDICNRTLGQILQVPEWNNTVYMFYTHGCRQVKANIAYLETQSRPPFHGSDKVAKGLDASDEFFPLRASYKMNEAKTEISFTVFYADFEGRLMYSQSEQNATVWKKGKRIGKLFVHTMGFSYIPNMDLVLGGYITHVKYTDTFHLMKLYKNPSDGKPVVDSTDGLITYVHTGMAHKVDVISCNSRDANGTPLVYAITKDDKEKGVKAYKLIDVEKMTWKEIPIAMGQSEGVVEYTFAYCIEEHKKPVLLIGMKKNLEDRWMEFGDIDPERAEGNPQKTDL